MKAYRVAPIAMLLLAAGTGVQAQKISITVDDDSVARIIDRIDVKKAAFSIVSTDGEAALALRDTTIVLQLTDRGLKALHDGTGERSSVGVVANVLGGMMRHGLAQMLDHAVEYSLTDLKEAKADGSRIVLLNVRGEPVFDEVEVNGRRLLEKFSASDGKAFAAKVNAARKALHQHHP